MRILVLALPGIGDALMFTPALRLLREARPDAEIHALAMIPGVRDLYARNPNVDQVLFFDFMKEGVLRSLRFVAGLRGRYDESITLYPSNRLEYNAISFLIGARRRAAVSYRRMNRRGLSFLNTITVPENDALHNVEENVRLVEALTGRRFDAIPPLEFPLPEEDEAFAAGFLREKEIFPGDLVIGMHPGSAVLKNHIHRRWAPEKFAELAGRLAREKGATVLLFGGPEEAELRARILAAADHPRVMEARTRSLSQSAAIMRRCDAFVSNDSSLMHVASALGLKVAALIGPTNPAYIRPWRAEHRLVTLDLECAPCFFYSPRPLECRRDDVPYKCVRELGVEQAFAAVEALLAAAPAPGVGGESG